jgi:uncharacterized membrane protein
MTFILIFGIGFVAGLRSMTGPMAVAWGAYLGWLPLAGTRFSFMASPIAVGIFTLLALGEHVMDLLPKTPARTAPGPLIGRLVMGGFTGACLGTALGPSWIVGALLGAMGAVAGTFIGYQVRHRLVASLKVKDAFVAIPETLLAIALSYLIVSA